MSTVVLPALSSARGLLSLLDDPERELQAHALRELDGCVDTFWPEIATNIPKMSEQCTQRTQIADTCTAQSSRPAEGADRSADIFAELIDAACSAAFLLVLFTCGFPCVIIVRRCMRMKRSRIVNSPLWWPARSEKS